MKMAAAEEQQPFESTLASTVKEVVEIAAALLPHPHLDRKVTHQ